MKKRWIIIIVAAFGALALGGAVAVAAGGSSLSSGPNVAPANALTKSEPHPEDDFYLGAPPDGYQPKVSAEEAVSVASSQETLADASLIQPTLATLTMPHLQPVDPETDKPIGPPYIVDEPVWVVTVDGICAGSSGGAFVMGDGAESGLPSADPCAYHEAKIIINATTGEMIIEATFVGPDNSDK